MKWRVVNQTPGTDTINGQAVRGWNVTFALDSGESGTVFVPGSEHTVENVTAIVSAEAANLHAINSLTGEV